MDGISLLRFEDKSFVESISYLLFRSAVLLKLDHKRILKKTFDFSTVF